MDEPVWLRRARTFVGTREGVGPVDNPVIMSWAKRVGVPWVADYYKHDSIPWCGLFMGMVMYSSGFTVPSGLLAALSWRSWGQELTQGAPGAVLVFQREGGGHVALYVGEDTECYHTLGGNQSDAVTDNDRIPKARCVAMRWPAGVALPSGDCRVMVGGVGETAKES